MNEAVKEPKMNARTSTTQTEKQQLSVEVFQGFERRDENQILAEMRGELIEDLVYGVDIQRRRVTNLSYAGVKEAIRRRGNLEILSILFGIFAVAEVASNFLIWHLDSIANGTPIPFKLLIGGIAMILAMVLAIYLLAIRFVKRR